MLFTKGKDVAKTKWGVNGTGFFRMTAVCPSKYNPS